MTDVVEYKIFPIYSTIPPFRAEVFHRLIFSRWKIFLTSLSISKKLTAA